MEFMGINIYTNTILYRSIDLPIQDIDMLLLGNLYVRTSVRNGFKRANKHYQAAGFRSATSMDINGRADIKIDLGEPIDFKYQNRYRCIINGGTGEHVKNQKLFYENVDMMAKLGAIIIHVGPEEGSFKGHSDYYYTEEYYQRYAESFRYQILTIERHEHRQGWAVYGAFKK